MHADAGENVLCSKVVHRPWRKNFLWTGPNADCGELSFLGVAMICRLNFLFRRLAHYTSWESAGTSDWVFFLGQASA